jgi:F0F1-type ATP synthase membrane subunit b/b'
MWLLKRIVYGPLKKGIGERREALTEREESAKARMDAAEELEQRARTMYSELEELRAKTIRQAIEQAAEEKARLLEQAREDAAAERARAQRLLDSEREAALAWVRELAVEHGTDVAGRMLMQLAPDAVEEALFERLLDELSSRSNTLRDAAARTARAEADVTFAHMPPDEQVARLRERLTAALGKPPRLVLREDDALLAGLCVRLGHLVLDASVLGQLQAFREDVREQFEPEASVA